MYAIMILSGSKKIFIKQVKKHYKNKSKIHRVVIVTLFPFPYSFFSRTGPIQSAVCSVFTGNLLAVQINEKYLHHNIMNISIFFLCSFFSSTGPTQRAVCSVCIPRSTLLHSLVIYRLYR